MQLSTSSPWSSSTPRAYGTDPPASAQLLITRHDRTEVDWQQPAFAAALDQRLLWCSGASDTPSEHQQHPQQQQQIAASAGWCSTAVSDAQHGHTAYVSALVELPASSDQRR